MNAIIGLTHLALKTNLTSAQYDYLSKIFRSAQSLLGIINDILDFSKIEAGKVVLRKSRFDLVHVIRQSLDGFVPSAGEKQLSLNYEGPESFDFFADADKFRQILDNLISNGLRFTQEGGITVKLQPGMKMFCVRCRTAG